MKNLALISFAVLAAPLAGAAQDLSWKDTEGKHVELMAGDRPVVRYLYEPIDTSSAERRDETYKPFHQVYDFSGDDFITKGAGGRYPHHRGIFFGFSKTKFTDADGKEHTADTWHCRKAWQEHEKFLSQDSGDGEASRAAQIGWFGDDETRILTEERTLAFRPADKSLTIDFTSTLKPDVPNVTLDGDPQHAGFQFRASNEVNDKTAKQTYYIRPDDGKGKPGETRNWPDDQSQKDLPWKAMSFVVDDQRYTAVYLDHPENPKPSMHSERDYGRFGSYFVADVTPDDPLTVRYRLVILEGETTPPAIAQMHAEFVGR